jgi:DNA polymerase-3 subunit delta'
MNIGWKIFGHDLAKRVLERQLSAGNLPQAYLFSGPAGIGKKALALEFAQKVLESDNLSTHPDLNILDQTDEITVEQMRQLIGRLNLKPLVGKKKVTIINNAELMNQQSSNALLKTLEEPSPSTIIILVGNSRRMLPTIVSRCQVLFMQTFSDRQLSDFAKGENLRVSAESLKLSFGSPAELKKLAGDGAYASDKKEILGRWQKLRKSQTAERLLSVAEYADMETGDLRNIFLTWAFGQQLSLTDNPRDFAVISALSQAWQDLGANLNKKSVLQNLFLKV